MLRGAREIIANSRPFITVEVSGWFNVNPRVSTEYESWLAPSLLVGQYLGTPIIDLGNRSGWTTHLTHDPQA